MPKLERTLSLILPNEDSLWKKAIVYYMSKLYEKGEAFLLI